MGNVIAVAPVIAISIAVTPVASTTIVEPVTTPAGKTMQIAAVVSGEEGASYVVASSRTPSRESAGMQELVATPMLSRGYPLSVAIIGGVSITAFAISLVAAGLTMIPNLARGAADVSLLAMLIATVGAAFASRLAQDTRG